MLWGLIYTYAFIPLKFKMISNCKGCIEEIEQAIYSQDNEGLHLATIKNIKSTYPYGYKEHFAMLMVDDNGNIIIN